MNETDCVFFQLYRFWMFFSHLGWYWVVLPSLMFLTSVGTSLNAAKTAPVIIIGNFSPFAHSYRHALRPWNHSLVYD